MLVLEKIRQGYKSGRKELAVLIDPDHFQEERIAHVVTQSEMSKVDYFFVGGSLVKDNAIHDCVKFIKSLSKIPVILFPGSTTQVTEDADALFFLSLISGRNPDLLIGKHVESAPILKALDLEILSTGYMLIDGGRPTTVSYVSNTLPIPADKPQIAACTAMAGELLGMNLIYLDSGSGAKWPVNSKIISAVRKNTDLPIIVGGGISSPELAIEACQAGANIIVAGTAFESEPELIFDMSKAVHQDYSLSQSNS